MWGARSIGPRYAHTPKPQNQIHAIGWCRWTCPQSRSRSQSVPSVRVAPDAGQGSASGRPSARTAPDSVATSSGRAGFCTAGGRLLPGMGLSGRLVRH